MDMPQEQALWIGPNVVRPDGTAELHNCTVSEQVARLLEQALRQMTPQELGSDPEDRPC